MASLDVKTFLHFFEVENLFFCPETFSFPEFVRLQKHPPHPTFYNLSADYTKCIVQLYLC